MQHTHQEMVQKCSDPPAKTSARSEKACPSCGAISKSEISLIEAQRFQRVYRQQVDEFLHGPHI